ncbi:MAG: molybdate ABC transporter substrate-binding protein [Armatimonadota bacterium]
MRRLAAGPPGGTSLAGAARGFFRINPASAAPGITVHGQRHDADTEVLPDVAHGIGRPRTLMLLMSALTLLAVTTVPFTTGCPRGEEEVSPAAGAGPVSDPDVDPAARTTEGPSATEGETTYLDVWVPCAYAPAMAEITPMFEEEHPGVKIRPRVENIALFPGYILEGETPDVLMGIGDVEVGAVEEAGKVDYKQAFCFVEIALVVPKGNPKGIETVEDLASDRVESLAVGTDDISVGHYGRELLQKAGVWDQVKDKVIEVDMPVTLLEFTVQGKVDAALAYGACVKAEKGEAMVKMGSKLDLVPCEIDAYCPAVPSPAATIAGCAHPELGREFIDLLTTDPVQEIIARYGFLKLSDPKCF